MCDMHNESPSCPSLRIAEIASIEVRAASESKLMLGRKKEQMQTQIVFTLILMASMLGKLCLSFAFSVQHVHLASTLGDHVGHSILTFLARWA